jgi:hypothetical protein
MVSKEVAERGYAFNVIGRDEFKYVEGAEMRTARIYVQMLFKGPVRHLIYVSTIDRWLPPHDSEPITAEKRAQIVQRMTDWLDQLGWTYRVDWSDCEGL